MRVALTHRRVAGALIVIGLAGSAAAQAATSAPQARPASGTAGSQITLLDLSVAGHPVSVGRLTLNSGVATGKSVLTAVIADGKAYGETPVSTGSVSLPSVSSDGLLPDALSKLVTVTSPGASMSAGSGVAHAGTTSLGTINLLGLPVALDGSATADTAVDGTHAGAKKTLVVRNLALPSIGGLLGTAGLDITKLSASTLTTLIDKLGLVDGTITTTRAALDAALAPLQPQLTAAQQQVALAQQQVAAAKDQMASTTAALGTATTALDSAMQSLQAALGTAPHLRVAALLPLPTISPTLPAVLPTVLPTALPTVLPSALPTALPTALPSALPTVLPTSLPTALPSVLPTPLPVPSLPAVIPVNTQPLVDAYNAAGAAYTAALAQVNAATGALNLANGVLNTAGTTVNTLLSTVTTQASAVVHAIVALLGRTPLVAVDSFTISTEASATSAGSGGQSARVVGGELQGVHVLGTDVLVAALGRDRVALSDLSGQTMALVTQEISGLTGALSSVLSSVSGLPSLSVPAPQVSLLSQTTSTGAADGFGNAGNVVHALRVTLPALTIPPAVQMAAPVGALRTQALGDLLTQPLVIAVGSMHDSASFRPAVVPGGSVPPGSSTGSPTGTAATPTGSTPTGVPAGTPTGSTPTGTTPAGSDPNAGPPSANGSDPQLPRTGLGDGVGLLALGLCAAGLLLYRRRPSDA